MFCFINCLFLVISIIEIVVSVQFSFYLRGVNCCDNLTSQTLFLKYNKEIFPDVSICNKHPKRTIYFYIWVKNNMYYFDQCSQILLYIIVRGLFVLACNLYLCCNIKLSSKLTVKGL